MKSSLKLVCALFALSALQSCGIKRDFAYSETRYVTPGESSISGIVIRENDNMAMPESAVFISDLEPVLTDSLGYFSIQVEPDIHKITFKNVGGFNTRWIDSVELIEGESVFIVIHLKGYVLY